MTFFNGLGPAKYGRADRDRLIKLTDSTTGVQWLKTPLRKSMKEGGAKLISTGVRISTAKEAEAEAEPPPSEPPSEPLTSPLPAAFSPHSVRDEAEELEDAESAEAEAPGEEEVVETEAPSLRPPSKRSRTAPNRLDATQSKKKAAKTDSKGKGKVLCCQSALIHSLCLSAWVCCAGGGRLEWRWQGN